MRLSPCELQAEFNHHVVVHILSVRSTDHEDSAKTSLEHIFSSASKVSSPSGNWSFQHSPCTPSNPDRNSAAPVPVTDQSEEHDEYVLLGGIYNQLQDQGGEITADISLTSKRLTCGCCAR